MSFKIPSPPAFCDSMILRCADGSPHHLATIPLPLFCRAAQSIVGIYSLCPSNRKVMTIRCLMPRGFLLPFPQAEAVCECYFRRRSELLWNQEHALSQCQPRGLGKLLLNDLPRSCFCLHLMSYRNQFGAELFLEWGINKKCNP